VGTDNQHLDEGILMQARGGFTLMEVIVALFILAISMLGAQALASTMIRTVTTSNAQMAAAQLVEDRIDLIRTDPAYDSLQTRYAGTESPVTGWPTYSRETQLSRTRDSTAAGIKDYIMVTVEVSGTGLRQPVRRTTVIGSP
jgi:prepilin-type N-terminal cleavage/methylation domain-containing protein